MATTPNEPDPRDSNEPVWVVRVRVQGPPFNERASRCIVQSFLHAQGTTAGSSLPLSPLLQGVGEPAMVGTIV